MLAITCILYRYYYYPLILQNKVYQEDFEAERKSREKASASVRKMQLRVDALEKENRELMEQLNSQAARQFHEVNNTFSMHTVIHCVYVGLFFQWPLQLWGPL